MFVPVPENENIKNCSNLFFFEKEDSLPFFFVPLGMVSCTFALGSLYIWVWFLYRTTLILYSWLPILYTWFFCTLGLLLCTIGYLVCTVGSVSCTVGLCSCTNGSDNHDRL